MNWDRIEGSWKQLHGHVREQWGRLTDDHLIVLAAKRDAGYAVAKEKCDALAGAVKSNCVQQAKARFGKS